MTLTSPCFETLSGALIGQLMANVISNVLITDVQVGNREGIQHLLCLKFEI